MSVTIFDVKITLDGIELKYGTSFEYEKEISTDFVGTFDGQLPTRAKNTGGTLSFEHVIYPESAGELNRLQDLLDKGIIKTVVVSGKSYDRNQNEYTTTVTGTNNVISSEGFSWEPDSAPTFPLELLAGNITIKRE